MGSDPKSPDENTRPRPWFERARSNELAPRDTTGADLAVGANTPLAMRLARSLGPNTGVASIDLAAERLSEPAAVATLRLAAVTAGWDADRIEIRSAVNGVVVLHPSR
jgi:multidrug resistance efflux pump